MLIDHTTGANVGLIFDINNLDMHLCAVGRNITVNTHVKKGENIDTLITYTIQIVGSKVPEVKLDTTYNGVDRILFKSKDDEKIGTKMIEVEKKVCKENNMTYMDDDEFPRCQYSLTFSTREYQNFFELNRVTFDIDVLSPGIDLGNFDLSNSHFGRAFRFHFEPFKAQMHVNTWQKIYINDASLLDFTIDIKINDENKFRAETIETISQAKSITFNIIGEKP